MPKTGRPPAIAAEHYPLLTKLAHTQPYSSQAELAQAFHAQTCITAHPDTFAKALKLAGTSATGSVEPAQHPRTPRRPGDPASRISLHLAGRATTERGRPAESLSPDLPEPSPD